MDIDLTLATVLELSAKVMRLRDSGAPDADVADVADDLAEHVSALNGWINSGGDLPAAWRFHQRAAGHMPV